MATTATIVAKTSKKPERKTTEEQISECLGKILMILTNGTEQARVALLVTLDAHAFAAFEKMKVDEKFADYLKAHRADLEAWGYLETESVQPSR